MKTQNSKQEKIEIYPMGWIESPITAVHKGPAQGQEAKVKGKIIILKNSSPLLKV
ncbi:MAG: hypothetical protein KIIPBIDF_01802 [Candidatus Methanoperedenaceae archaeon GB50]|nr:MAG: hypothetical protein KIIPBIDF_01802 [Candidatus Methanoperedenaceae archaeon GB50]